MKPIKKITEKIKSTIFLQSSAFVLPQMAARSALFMINDLY